MADEVRDLMERPVDVMWSRAPAASVGVTMIMRVRMGMIVGVRAFMRVTVSRIVVAQHLDTGGGNAGAQDTGDAQLVAGPEGAERILERLERQAGIEQGTMSPAAPEKQSKYSVRGIRVVPSASRRRIDCRPG
jgi:hypothetical protein